MNVLQRMALFGAVLAVAACSSESSPLSTPVGTQRAVHARHIAIPAIARRGFAAKTQAAAENPPDGDFESGGFTYWQQCGDVNASIEKSVTNGTAYAAQMGSTTSEPDGDAGVCQAVTVPASGTLSFSVKEATNETSTSYAYQEADFLDSNGDVLDNFYTTDDNSNTWKIVNVNAASYVGQTVYLYFGVHADGASKYHIVQYVDNVAFGGTALSSPSPSPSTAPSAAPSATPSPKPSTSPTASAKPTAPASAKPTVSPTATAVPSTAPSATPYPCNNAQFTSDQNAFAAGSITSDQFVQICGAVTKVLPEQDTSSGHHGYFYVALPSGYDIEIVSNLDAMAEASTDQPPATWPWVSVNQYVYVQGRYYYDSSSSQGIDWTEDDTSSSWSHLGYVAVCTSSGANCMKYW